MAVVSSFAPLLDRMKRDATLAETMKLMPTLE